ncbi:MAG: dihydrofolate reductase family protein [Actinobacteria bacterium]|nr:dihydrofolate reductase family protein [Actinomycetota bacterium]
MAVYATLVTGSDGSTTKGGSSRAITSGADRSEFLSRRRTADFILIGGKTARSEPYHRTPVPVVIASRSMVNALTANRNAHWWNCSPSTALDRGIKKFGSNVLVEGGANFIFDLISSRSLDGIYLSVTPESGGESKIDYDELLAKFSEVSSREVDGTQFFEARKLKI